VSYEDIRALGTFGQGVALVEKAQKQVFRLNPWRAKLTGFIASEENRPPSLLCIPLKHEMLPNVNNCSFVLPLFTKTGDWSSSSTGKPLYVFRDPHEQSVLVLDSEVRASR
jgi:hypothetical protein